MKPCEFVDLEQGTPEWLAWRNGGIGGSDAPIIMGVSPWRTAYELWHDKVFGAPQRAPNAAQSRGIELEPKVRAIVAQKYDLRFIPTCVSSTQHPFLRASLDGLAFSTDHAEPLPLEIKSLNPEGFRLAHEGRVPDYYLPQLQHNMLVLGVSKCVYAACLNDPPKNQPLDVVTFEVYADPKQQSIYLKRAIEFWNRVLTKNPPPQMKVGYETVTDVNAINAANEYVAALQRAQEAQKLLDEAKTRLLDTLPKNQNSLAGPVTVAYITRAGNVDYKHPDIQRALREADIDIELYRVKPTQFTKIDVVQPSNGSPTLKRVTRRQAATESNRTQNEFSR